MGTRLCRLMAELEEALKSIGIGGAQASAGTLSARAEDYGNDPNLEQMWAIKSIKYAETHFKLIQSVDSTNLRITRHDDDIFENFKKKLKGVKVDVLDPDDFKTEEAKEVLVMWRPFCNQYEGLVHDFNFGTLLRVDVSKGYSEDNTLLVPRIQFLAVEVARNKLGLNSVHSSTQS